METSIGGPQSHNADRDSEDNPEENEDTMRGVTKHRSMSDWLGSKPPGSGGGGKFLSGWKDFKKGTGLLDTWMHTKTLPMTVWRHSFPMLIVVEDKKTKEKVTHVWSRGQTCHETEDVLDKQYWRETKGDPSSARSHPPERCGMCKFGEWLWQQSWRWIETHTWDEDGKKWVEKKKGKGQGIDPCAVLFRFVSEASDDENTTIHVGGYCGLFGRDELPIDLLKAMKASKIHQKEAWKENCGVKAKSVMCIVDNDKPDNGVQISEETKELGEKVKDEITRVLKSLEVDIQRSPYCIRWEYDKSQNMGKQYTATAMMKIKPSDRVLKLIRSKEVPDTSPLETPFNQQSMRAIMEKHCRLEKGSVPWSEIFPSKEQEKAWEKEDEQADDESDDVDRGSEDRDSDVEGDNPADDHDADEAETDEDGDELVACDDCGKVMKISAAKCPHCGKVYEVEEEEPEEEPEPEKPKMRSRAEVAAEKKAKAKGATNGKAKAKQPPASTPNVSDDDEDEDDDDQDGDIPF